MKLCLLNGNLVNLKSNVTAYLVHFGSECAECVWHLECIYNGWQDPRKSRPGFPSICSIRRSPFPVAGVLRGIQKLQRSHIQFWDEIVIHQNTQRNSFQTWTLLWAGTHQWSGIAQRIVMSWVVHFLDTNNLIQLNQDVLTKVERRYGRYPFTVMWSSLPYSAYHFSDNVKHILKYPRPTFPIWVVSRKTWLHCLKNDKELWSDNSEVSLKLDVT